MRYAVLCVLVGLTGCAKPEDETPPPPPAEEVACATQPPEELHIPQDPGNLLELEDARRHGDPLEKDLANGRFRYGGNLAELTIVYPPKYVLHHGEYSTAVYKDGGRESLSVITRNGKMVCASAGSCVHHVTFFDGRSDEQRQAWYAGYTAARQARFNWPPLPPAPVPPAVEVAPPPREVGAKP